MAIHGVKSGKISAMIFKSHAGESSPVKRKIIRVVIFVALVGLVVSTSVRVGFAAYNLNFTGTYVHPGQKGASDLDPEVTLEVAQSDGAIEVTREEQGSKTTNRFSLNGAESDCVSPGDVAGKCKARLKGKTLILEYVVLSNDQTTGATVHIRTTEEWQLSGDSKTLTIKLHVDFPDRAASAVDSEGRSLEVDKYTRQ